MLEVQAITRHYGDLKAVDDVSFSIKRGEIVGLLGHNGAGKTTIMKMLSGFLEPDSGSISFHGQAVSTNPQALQRELGYLPENPPIYPELSVASYLDYAAELKGLTGDEKRNAIRHVIEATELGSKLLSPIATLSRGMKQRVGVAQAIIGQPSLLILDEPTNGLDPTQTEQMRQLIRNISETATVILSTHIMQEVEALCDRALIIRQGQLAVDARLNELKQGNRILLHSTASADTVNKVLSAQAWIANVESREHVSDTADGQHINEFGLTIDDHSRINERLPELARVMVGENIPVHGLSTDSRDLQSLFIQVNEHRDQAAADESAVEQVSTEKEVDHVA